jgi:hypothetical protein
LKSPYLTASYTNSVGPIKFGIEIYLTRLLFFKTLRRLGAIFETPCIGSKGRNSDRLRNSERRSMGKSRRIQNTRENRVGPSPNSFEEAKERERTEKERSGG